MRGFSSASPADSPQRVAEQWISLSLAAGPMPVEAGLPTQPAESLAALAEAMLARKQSLLILVPDDEPLPAISTALDLALRPLCLVLPCAEFAARIALRATLSLLRSRLARDGDEEQTDIWRLQKARLREHAAHWQKALAWSAGNDRSAWPNEVAKLFPVRILPVAAFRTLSHQGADLVVFYRCDLGLEMATIPGRHLHIGQAPSRRAQSSVALNDEEMQLRAELAQITLDVGELELELATAEAEMSEFSRRYFDQVARRLTELDSLKAELASRRSSLAPENQAAREEAENLRREAQRSAQESQRFAQAEEKFDARPEPTPFRPQQDVKRLFRQLAQKIHPDRACDEDDRHWRTQLMAEANRAYRAADTQALREVAALWEEGRPSTAPASGELPAQAKEMVRRQLDKMRRRFAEIQSELNRLFGSRLYELFVAARQAWRHGRDLLQEMAASLDAQIRAARLQLGDAA